ncbi:thioredoxin [Eubacteriales bacterium KG127]
MVVNVNNDNFEAEVLKSDVPVIVDFWAPWCGHCVNLAPTLDEIAEEKKGSVKVCKVNVDESQELAMKYGIMTIPAVFLFESGEKKANVVGALPKAALLSKLGL